MDDQHRDKPPPRPPLRLPWWTFVLLAIGSYCTLRYVIPDIHPANPVFGKFARLAPSFAPPVTILFLLLAAKRLYDGDIGKPGGEERTINEEENRDQE